MVKIESSISNCIKICYKTIQEWNKIKSKNEIEIDDIIRNYLDTLFNLYNI